MTGGRVVTLELRGVRNASAVSGVAARGFRRARRRGARPHRPNGAGKSTLIGCITGINRLDAGAITLRGERIERLPVHQRARLGISRTFQKIRLAQPLTVFDNVALGLAAQQLARASGYLRLFTPASIGSVASRVTAALESWSRRHRGRDGGVAPVRHAAPSKSPARWCGPQVLLLDEPAGIDRPSANAWAAWRGVAGADVWSCWSSTISPWSGSLHRVTVLEDGREFYRNAVAAQDNEA